MFVNLLCFLGFEEMRIDLEGIMKRVFFFFFFFFFRKNTFQKLEAI